MELNFRLKVKWRQCLDLKQPNFDIILNYHLSTNLKLLENNKFNHLIIIIYYINPFTYLGVVDEILWRTGSSPFAHFIVKILFSESNSVQITTLFKILLTC